MIDDKERLSKLTNNLNALSFKQTELAKELETLRAEVVRLQESDVTESVERKIPTPISVPYSNESAQQTAPIIPDSAIPIISQISPQSPQPSKDVKSNLEKFIGENLINKIGIVIIVIGVAIGAKYAIDHELISPLTRIVLGYMFGVGLLGVAFRLKQKYESFSAVLLSGSTAILYFITYWAYSFYQLIPQSLAFALMIVFTAFTVFAAIRYNRQVIAHVGLVGAYAVPFLLSRGNGNIVALFSYIAIINVGIMVVSCKKYWKSLYYVAFPLTWLIYTIWYVIKYNNSDATIALIFAGIFFATFYAIFLCYKLLHNCKYNKGDILLLLANAFIFFGFGYAIFNKTDSGKQLLGLFTLFNALIHFAVGVILYKKKLVDKQFFYLIVGLVLVFITIAIPVQLDGNWVTLLWAGEAALLCWIGRTKKVALYEQLSLPLMLLAFISIIHDWDHINYALMPIFNIQVLCEFLFIVAFGWITFMNISKNYPTCMDKQKLLTKIISITAVSIFLISLYFLFFWEIKRHFAQVYYNFKYESVWLINYTLLFFATLTVVNMRKIRNKELSHILLVLNVAVMLCFLIKGLYDLGKLCNDTETLIHPIRYISFIFAGGMLAVLARQIRDNALIIKNLYVPIALFLHLAILWIASNELINWLDIADFENKSYKLGLSILWGAYSLALIVLGILKKKSYLRIGAMSLFGVTLVKLFFYDLTHLDTISKTIVFVSLGILLLVISFLYNKYKYIIFDESNKNTDEDKNQF